ncbi:nucleoside phosphorylase [Zobellia galactanivorans]|uniref:nucleoside phosphorylase n=1 Tax=Zobellia galactanivorans (strain DSM 12802 / CCUG 47099 / CIP 106680 / NCIMB 13871 / Dsij) TaxID=63186 RepID=UPI001C072D36|nr:nucleoside phosphorylase [Zobellia galactanivorans]MBU3024806.1 nucleoside phosphorylase [Zobellia galactanivorans]
MQLRPSELVLNADKSIYHLNLRPEDIGHTIITVGDPDRVGAVSKFFDTVELKKGKREFHTHTGTLNGKHLSVVSTGIGTDNIDIVFNELDALVNIDFDTRSPKEEKTVLDIVRIGTSGSIRPDIPIDSFLMSEYAIGFDGLLHFYDSEHIQETDISKAFVTHADWSPNKSVPYVVKYDKNLGDQLMSNRIRLGATVTNIGFYGPQSRVLRLQLSDPELQAKLDSFEHKGIHITNLEMETSGIYGLSKLLGHRAVSMNCILANRATGAFSTEPTKSVENLIQHTLEKLTTG